MGKWEEGSTEEPGSGTRKAELQGFSQSTISSWLHDLLPAHFQPGFPQPPSHTPTIIHQACWRSMLGCLNSGHQLAGKEESQAEPRCPASSWWSPLHRQVDLQESSSYHSREKKSASHLQALVSRNPCEADSIASHQGLV